MYLAIDVGGTKTLLATFTKDGQIKHKVKFPTNKDYFIFFEELEAAIKKLGVEDLTAAAIAIPGKIDRKHGIALDCGNLPWEDVPVQANLERILGCPVLVENDANLAGLSEALLIHDKYKKVLYLTISTGIGSGVITNGIIDPELADSEAGQMLIEHDGQFKKWEHFASGHAIVERTGKLASEIIDEAEWQRISRDFAVGMLSLIAIIQPEVIVIGGGVGSHFERYEKFLTTELKKYELPLSPTPPLVKAQHTEEAVIYGCYNLIKQRFGAHHGHTTHHA